MIFNGQNYAKWHNCHHWCEGGWFGGRFGGLGVKEGGMVGWLLGPGRQ